MVRGDGDGGGWLVMMQCLLTYRRGLSASDWNGWGHRDHDWTLSRVRVIEESTCVAPSSSIRYQGP